MTIKQGGVGCGALVLALAAFGVYRVAMPWETYRFGGYLVQRNRWTERVRLRVGETWQGSLDDTPTAVALPVSELARLHFSNWAWGRHGYLCGTATVMGSQPVQGRLAFLVNVDDSFSGKRRVIEAERALRCNVRFVPGAPQPFVLNTAMTAPADGEKFRVTLVPVTAVNQ